MTDAVAAIGVIVPVHNEEDHLRAALSALDTSLDGPARAGLAVHVAVVLDACSDASVAVAKAWLRAAGTVSPGIRGSVLAIDARNVGIARRSGADHLLAEVDAAPSALWLATTDADSVVPPQWMRRQLQQRRRGVQLWIGVVDVLDWSGRHPGTERAWRSSYAGDSTPVHGASLAFCAEAYQLAGGFPPVASGEDRALCRTMQALGVRACLDRTAPVITSSRRTARAPAGFAAALDDLEQPDPR